MNPYRKARVLIDEAHEADPRRLADGRAAELAYADAVEAWVKRLRPDAEEILLLAARCQHLERWRVPRDSFPADRSGYLSWRRLLYTQQAERARALMLEAGVGEEEAEEAFRWVSKSGLKTNPGTQALEDAAILVFLENELASFVAKHADYEREKFVGILQKSWKKLSPPAREEALELDFPPEIGALLKEALED